MNKEEVSATEVHQELLHREQEFHDRWAESIDIREIVVDDLFSVCTAPECRQILKWLGDVNGKSILDLGCGAGEAAVFFAKLGGHATASDLSEGMLTIANRLADYHGVSIDTEASSADELPFPDESFDIVYAANLLHHVPIEPVLDEVFRVLRPGGEFVSWDPLAYNFFINVYRRNATEVRTPDETPLKLEDIDLFRKRFQSVQYECFWFTTLWIFLSFYLFERVDPNKERYWKKIIIENKRLEKRYRFFEKIDRILLSAFPYLKRYCWNIVVYARKQA